MNYLSNSIKNNLNYFLLGLTSFLVINDANIYFGYNARSFVSIIGILFLFLNLVNKLNEYVLKRITEVIILYFFILLFAYFTTQNVFNFEQIYLGTVSLLFFITGISLKSFNYNNIEINFNIIFLVLIIFIVGNLKFIFVFNYFDSISRHLNVSREIGDDYLNSIGIAYSKGVTILFVYFLFNITENRFLKILALITIFLSFIVIISTLTRGVFIYLILILFFLILKQKRLFIYILIFILLFYFSFLAFNLQYKFPIFERITFLFNRYSSLYGNFGNRSRDLSAIDREINYNYFINNYHNLFFGKLNYKPYPHNIFLEIYFRLGIFGLPLIYHIIKTFFRTIILFFTNKNKKLNFLFILFFIFSFLQSLTSMSLEMNKFFWLSYGYLSSSLNNINKNEDTFN